MERANARVGRLIDTGVEDSKSKVFMGWLIDHLLYLWDLIWGLIEPILSFLSGYFIQRHFLWRFVSLFHFVSYQRPNFT